MMNSVWHVYIIECSDGTLYTGITTDLIKRIATHNSGRGAKYTRPRTPVSLKISWECRSKSEASKEEYCIKELSRQEKLWLIELQLFSDKSYSQLIVNP